jgi:hypothetical protein
MKNASLKKYVKLRQSLLEEKAKIEARLIAINQALNSAAKSAAVVTIKAEASGKAPKAKKKMSADGRAAIAAAQKVRWAKIHAAKANGAKKA